LSEIISVPFTGEAIREYLSFRWGSPTDVYRELRKVKRRTSYDSVRRYFWILKQLGMVELVRREPGRFRIPRSIYRITPGMELDPRWSAPQAALYPETRWGGRRYARAQEKGLVKRGVPRRPGVLPGMEVTVPRPPGVPPPFPHGSRRPRR